MPPAHIGRACRHAHTSDRTPTPDSPTVEILDVTPEMPEQWLSRNSNNRNHRGQVIASYARDMSSGAWVLNGETVKIASNGHLLDGQHRLNAVVEAGATVPMIAARDIPAEVIPTVDAGAKLNGGIRRIGRLRR